MTAQGHSFPKSERISGVKDVAALLAGGKWCRSDLLKACYMRNGLEYSRVVVAVPKRLFKRAVKIWRIPTKCRKPCATKQNR